MGCVGCKHGQFNASCFPYSSCPDKLTNENEKRWCRNGSREKKWHERVELEGSSQFKKLVEQIQWEQQVGTDIKYHNLSIHWVNEGREAVREDSCGIYMYVLVVEKPDTKEVILLDFGLYCIKVPFPLKLTESNHAVSGDTSTVTYLLWV